VGSMQHDPLAGCPADEHVRWLIGVLTPGANLPDSEAVTEHLDLGGESAGDEVERLRFVRSGRGGEVADLLSWRWMVMTMNALLRLRHRRGGWAGLWSSGR
jgi:hypothetical protein